MFNYPYHLVYNVLLFGILLVIFYQDLQQRAVWWGNFVLLLVFVILYQLKYQSAQELLHNAMINSSFLCILFLLIAFYFLLRYKKFKFFNQYIGYGDAMFMFIIALKFSLNTFIIFLVTGNLIILLFIIVKRYYKKKDYLVPLAGMLALILIIWIIIFDLLNFDICKHKL